MNIDDQLQSITRLARSEIEKEKTKRLIQSKLKKSKRKTSWSYGIVLVSMCILVLFILSTTTTTFPLNDMDNTATPFGEINEQTTIEKVIVLENTNPLMNLNLNSIFYPLRESKTENESFDEMLEILQTAKVHAVPWNGTINDEYSVKDFHFHFSNDEELYIKLDSEQTIFLIDPYAKMKYELTKEERRIFNSFSNEIAENPPWSTTKKVVFITAIIIFIGSSVIIDRLEKKELKTKADSDDKEKSYTFIKVIVNLVAILSLNYFTHKIGTIHLGIVGLYFIIFQLSDYFIKIVIQKQPIFWKYEVVQWSISIGFFTFLLFFF